MKQMRLTIHDDYLLEGLRMQAMKDGVTPGAYVLSLVEADIKRRLGYKLIGRWSDGKVVTETNFYTMTVIVPLGGFGLLGIQDDSLGRWLGGWLRFQKKRRRISFRGEVRG